MVWPENTCGWWAIVPTSHAEAKWFGPETSRNGAHYPSYLAFGGPNSLAFGPKASLAWRADVLEICRLRC